VSLVNFVYFIILIGVLIFFHELGHFLAAKAFGVKVLKFALGFGRALVSFTWKETTYAVNWFPLGGYVKMLGQEPSELRPEELPEEEDRSRAFDQKPRWQRLLIIMAGPLFNLILPLPIYFLFLISQSALPPATVGSVIPDSPAWMAGLKPGDRIVSIDEQPIRYWEEMEQKINSSPDQTLRMVVLRHDEQLELQITPASSHIPNRIKALSRTVGLIGVTQAFLGAQLGVLGPETVAGRAGLKSWDVVLQADGMKVSKWVDLEEIFAKHAGRSLQLTVLRPEVDREGDELDLREVVEKEQGSKLAISLPVPPAGTPRAAGLDPGEFFVFKVDPGGAAERAGIGRGDRILSVDGESCANLQLCFRHFREEPEEIHTVTFLRPGSEAGAAEVRFQAEIEKKLNEVKQEEIHARIGLVNRSLLLPAEPVPNEHRWSRAVVGSFWQNWMMIKLNALGLGLLATGQISAKTVGGPIMMFDLAGKAAQRGWEDFLWLLAVISINLGLINLLPIPILDGGQIVFLGVEAVKRGPLSLRARIIAAYVGLTIIIFLMVFAFKNDIERYWDDFARLFQ